MKLSKRDCQNLIDALMEYDDQICPKELADDEVGLNAERLDNLMKRLIDYAHSRETQICGQDCDCENETFEDFAISRLSEKDIINWSKNNE
jgi:hypothetical protein